MTIPKSNNTKSSTDNHPDFITKELLETSLKNGLNIADIVVTDFVVSAGSSTGENYLSDIYRVKIVYTESGKPNNNISLIIKAMPFIESRTEIIDNLEMFDKELKMYTDTLPKISKLLDGEFMSARCFYAVKEPVQMIVFEDLKALGFQMANRHAGIDEAHCRLVLTKLGRLHAASVILAEMEPHHMDTYSFGFFKPNSKTSDVVESLFVNGLKFCIEEVQTWTGYENITKKMIALSDDFLTKMAKHCNQTPASIKVLNHGDLWINNFLFKYEEGKPVDIVFVDYQLSYYTSPGYDINYFLSTSPTNEVREKKVDLLIEEYHSNFAKIIGDSENRYSVDAFKKEIKSREFYGFCSSIGITPLTMMDQDTSKDSTVEKLMDENESVKLRKLMYSSENYCRAMRFLLKKFDEHKVLENVY